MIREREETKRDELSYHLIAITNIEDTQHRLSKWWHKKYGIPPKSLEDHTIEELFIEQLEDFYEANPEEIGKLKEMMLVEDDDWDGTMSDEHEKKMKKFAERVGHVDLTRFQKKSEDNKSDEFEDKYN